MSRREIRIAGFGGQGVVMMGNIIGKAAAIYDKEFATLTQSYGPESRGGSCKAEVVISDVPIDYPYVVNPQFLIILSQEAYAEYRQNVPPETLVIVDSDLVKVDVSQNHRSISIPASCMARELGRPVVANIIMLGFLAAISDIVTNEALRQSVLSSIPVGTESFNMRAFDLGYNYGVQHSK